MEEVDVVRGQMFEAAEAPGRGSGGRFPCGLSEEDVVVLEMLKILNMCHATRLDQRGARVLRLLLLWPFPSGGSRVLLRHPCSGSTAPPLAGAGSYGGSFGLYLSGKLKTVLWLSGLMAGGKFEIGPGRANQLRLGCKKVGVVVELKTGDEGTGTWHWVIGV